MSYPSVEVGGDLSQAHGGVAADWSLLVSRLQSCKVPHQLLIHITLIQLGGQQQHGLGDEKKDREQSVGNTINHREGTLSVPLE